MEPIERKSDIIFRNLKFNIGRLILRKLQSTPNFVGQVEYSTNKQSTFREMREKSVICALWLKKQGIKPNDIVAICTDNYFDAYIPYLACLYICVIANPWVVDLAEIEGNLKYFLNLCKPKVTFVDNKMAAKIYKIATKFNISTRIVVFDETKEFESLESILNDNSYKAEIDRFCAWDRDLRQTAMILFTSGTTGLPKAVNISDTIFIDWANGRSILLRNSIGLWYAPLGCIIGAVLTVRAILSHVKVIKPLCCFCPEDMCDKIQTYKISWVILETNMLYSFICMLTSRLTYDISSLKYLIFGGFRISGPNHQILATALPGVSIIQIYYTTETGIITQQRRIQNYDSSGQPAIDVYLKIVDSYGNNCHPKNVGNIYCYPSRLFNSYYKCNAAAQNIVDRQGWFYTGDVGYFDHNGDIFVLDHKQNIYYSIEGYIIPSQIEAALRYHSSVYNTCVMPVSYLNKLHLIILVEKSHEEAQIRTRDLLNLIRYAQNIELKNFGNYKLHFFIVDDMRRCTCGKIDLLMFLKNKKICLLMDL